MRGLAAAAFLTAGLVTATDAQQKEGSDADWPCVQRKVGSLTPAVVWTGPAIDEATTVDDPRIEELVARLAQRRLPVDDANAEIEAFAASLQPETKRDTLVALFSGLFRTLNAERSDVVEGIERYGRNQKALAQAVRNKAASVARLEQDPNADPAVVAARRDELAWDNRIFEERRASLAYVCEVPLLIEQRLFTLARTIEAALPEADAAAGN